MKIAENVFGPFDYTVTGDREDEAAAELERRLKNLDRSGLRYPRPSAYTLEDIATIRREIAAKYGVIIGTTLDVG